MLASLSLSLTHDIPGIMCLTAIQTGRGLLVYRLVCKQERKERNTHQKHAKTNVLGRLFSFVATIKNVHLRRGTRPGANYELVLDLSS